MAHIEKCKGSKATALIRHDERAQGVKDSHIDPSLSHLNYNLCDRAGDAPRYMNHRISEIKNGKKPRKDAIKAITVIVTAPKDLPEQEQATFFKSVFKFLENEYKKENIISAWVHYDEPGAMPHIHVKAVPAVGDPPKLSAKELITRAYLKGFHPRLQQAVEKDLGHAVSIINGMTAGKNKELAELKAEAAHQRAAELEHQIENYQDELVPLQAKVEAKKEYVREMEKDYDLITGVKPNKTPLTGKVKSYEVPKEVWETQRVTQMDRNAQLAAAERLEQIINDYPQLIKENKKLRESNQKMAFEIEKVNKVLDRMHPSTREAFFKHFNALDNITIPQPQRASQSLEKEHEEELERTKY